MSKEWRDIAHGGAMLLCAAFNFMFTAPTAPSDLLTGLMLLCAIWTLSDPQEER